MIEIGGDLYLSGVNSESKKWVIGVEKPTLAHTSAVQAVNVSDKGLATSGDYRNYFEHQGQRISHSIDPILGKPIAHTLASVIVIANTGAEADAYATALNVMGPEKGYQFALDNQMSAYFIIRNPQLDK